MVVTSSNAGAVSDSHVLLLISNEYFRALITNARSDAHLQFGIPRHRVLTQELLQVIRFKADAACNLNPPQVAYIAKSVQGPQGYSKISCRLWSVQNHVVHFFIHFSMLMNPQSDVASKMVRRCL